MNEPLVREGIATITFDSESASTLHERWLSQMTGWTARITREDGTARDVKIITEDGQWWGVLWVQDWDEETNTLLGTSYKVDLFGSTPDTVAVKALHIY